MKKKAIFKSSINNGGGMYAEFKHRYTNQLPEKYIYVESNSGLHCISLEDGVEKWHFNVLNGLTPAVDQAAGVLFYQSHTRMSKLDALTGAELDYSTTGLDGTVYSGNTVLVNDSHGYHIITYRHRWIAFGARVICYDANLNVEWSITTGLNSTIKNTLCYHDGLVYLGTGELFFNGQEVWYAGLPENCRIIAYNIADGSVAWETMLSDPVGKIFEIGGYGVMNIVYCNGYIIAEQSAAIASCPVKIQVLNATTGAIVKTFVDTTFGSSCGSVSFSYGRFITGNLNRDKMCVYQIGKGQKTDYGPYGPQKTNTMEAPDLALTSLDANITLVGSVAGGNQGSVVQSGKVYACYGNGNVVVFDVESLAVISTISTAVSWDSSPLVVPSKDREWRMLIHESANERTLCRKVNDGSLVWYSDNNQPGTAFFGYSYYEL